MIREATIWDALQITQLWKEMVKEVKKLDTVKFNPEAFYIKLILWIRSDNGCVFVYDDGGIKGFILGYVMEQDYSSELVGFGEALYIVPDFRGKGFNGMLVDKLIESLKAKGADKLSFETIYSDRLVKYWERKGFKPIRIKYERSD